jgi:hypothetical protein
LFSPVAFSVAGLFVFVLVVSMTSLQPSALGIGFWVWVSEAQVPDYLITEIFFH